MENIFGADNEYTKVYNDLVKNKKGYDTFLPYRVNNEIYLAINTNIKSFNNICPSKEDIWRLNDKDELDKWYNPKFGIYLGKIVFDKKGNKLIPKYIPTKFENLEEEVKRIKNPLWLANKNPNYIKPKFYGEGMAMGYYFESPNNLEYQCKIEKDTTILNQEQIISYVSEIHSKNVNMIKNYIDTINKDYGIKPFVFSDEIYDELGKLGILTKEQANNFKDKSYIKQDSILLTMLDYLAKQNKKDEDYLITFDDEYFYAYLVWSLKDFAMLYFQGFMQEQFSLLFNYGAYLDKEKYNLNLLDTKIFADFVQKTNNDLKWFAEMRISKQAYTFQYGFFYINVQNYLSREAIGRYAYQYEHKIGQAPKIIGFDNTTSPFDSPNFVYSSRNYHGSKKLIPSALGKYYFELSYQKEIYIELLRPYYPSIKDLPEGWDNKMLEKANLRE